VRHGVDCYYIINIMRNADDSSFFVVDDVTVIGSRPNLHDHFFAFAEGLVEDAAVHWGLFTVGLFQIYGLNLLIFHT